MPDFKLRALTDMFSSFIYPFCDIHCKFVSLRILKGCIFIEQ